MNYLALLGWSPGGGDELLPAQELARRFALEDVGHSAAVFDVEKLAWANRHYLRAADPDRLAELALPHFVSAGFVRRDTAARARLPGERGADGERVGGSDRAGAVAAALRLRVRSGPGLRGPRGPGGAERAGRAGRRSRRSPAELAGEPRLDRETFRAAAGRVKAATGQKGKHLFHPIRVALTGEAGGPELDLAVPAIDRGAELPAECGLAPILGCRERAARFAAWLERRSSDRSKKQEDEAAPRSSRRLPQCSLTPAGF